MILQLFAENNAFSKNKLFIASDQLKLPTIGNTSIDGGGVFASYSDKRQLTASSANKPTRWQLPSWIWPENKASILTYHKDRSRWTKNENGVLLQTVARGQEFILGCNDYPEAIPWAYSLFGDVETKLS